MLQHTPILRGLATKLAFCLSLIVAVSSARADLVQVDWKTSGDKMIVKDTVTGLEFLRLSASWRLSVNQVSAQLGTGGTFEGFRYATFAEVNAMLTDGGLPTIPDYHAGFAQTTISLDDLNRFIALFGDEDWGYGPQAYGFVADTFNNGYSTGVVTAIYSHDTAYGMAPRTAVTTYSANYGFNGAGSYLVRQGSMVDQVSQLKQQIADLQSQLAQDDDLIKSLQDQLAAANATNTTLTSDKAALTDQLATANQTIDALTADKALLTKQLQLAQNQLADAQAKTAATQAALADAQAANATLTATNAALNDQLAAANANIALLTKQNGLLSKNLDDAQAKLAATQNLLADTQATLATTQATLAQRDAALATANATIADLQAQLAQQQATVTALSSSLATAVGDSSFTIPGSTLEQQVSNLSTAITNLNPGQKKALYKNLGGK